MMVLYLKGIEPQIYMAYSQKYKLTSLLIRSYIYVFYSRQKPASVCSGFENTVWKALASQLVWQGFNAMDTTWCLFPHPPPALKKDHETK